MSVAALPGPDRLARLRRVAGRRPGRRAGDVERQRAAAQLHHRRRPAAPTRPPCSSPTPRRNALTTGIAGVLVAAAARHALGFTGAFVGFDLAMCALALVGVAAGRTCPPGRRGRGARGPVVSWAAMPYLDHAATTPMLPEAIAAVAERHGPSRQPVVAARRRPRRPPARRGVARDARRRRRRPPVRGDLHRRRHRVGQPRGQGHLLGPPRRRPAAAPRAGQRGRAPRRARRRRVAGRRTRAPRSPGCPVDDDRTGLRPTTLRAALERRPRLGRPGQRDVGEQRGRHRAADRRARRRRARVRRARSTPTPCRPSARCRSTSPRPGWTR